MEHLSALSGLWEFFDRRLDGLPMYALGALVITITLARLAPLFQRLLPRFWPRDPAARESFLTDAMYLSIGPVSALLAQILTSVGVAVAAVVIGHQLDLSLLKGFGPLVHQPYWLMLVEMMVVSDVISYWTHRMAHTFVFLWRFHSVHHSTEHMRGLSFARFHLLETWELLPNLAVLFLLGFPVDALAPIAPLTQLFAFYIHSDLPSPPRVLRTVLNSPGYHRWHHAKEVRGVGWNFGALLPLTDIIFGTYHYPKHAPEAYGIEDTEMPKTYLKQFCYAFRKITSKPTLALQPSAFSSTYHTASHEQRDASAG